VAQRERKLLGADTVSMKFVQMMKMKWLNNLQWRLLEA
jgi:hypothetical protein